MANNNTYKIWSNATHSVKSNFNKILNTVITGDYAKSYKLINRIVLNQNDELIGSLTELFLSVTNIPTSNNIDLLEILQLIYDEDNEGFKYKEDETLPFLNADETTDNYIIITADKTSDKVNMVDDDSGYYLRIGSNGQLFCFPKTGLLQYLGENSDTQLLDTYNKGDARPVQQSRAYDFIASNWLEFGAGFEVGDTLTYTKTDNTTDTVNLDANKRAFDGVAIRIFNYEINSHIFNCEDRAGNTSYSTTTGVTSDIYGSLTGFHVIDHRKTTCYLDSVGFAVNSSTPDVAIPLASDGTPVASYDTMYSGIVPKNVDFVNASAFVNNNSDNVCDIGSIQQDELNLGFIFKPRLFEFQTFGWSSSYYVWRINNFNELVIRQADGSYYTTGVMIDEERFYILFIKMYLDGSDHKTKIFLDNVLVHTSIAIDIPYNVFSYANLCYIGGATSVKEVACTFINKTNTVTDEEALNWKGNAIKGGSDELLIPFLGEGTSNTVYDVNNNTAYSIAGTVTSGVSWSGQNEYNFKEVYGYTAPNIPASLLNIGQDVLGATLEFSHCEIGSNDGSQKRQPLAADLIHADDDEIYFDKTNPALVIAKELDNADLPVNGGYTTWHAVDNCKMQGTIYDHDLSLSELIQIDECYLKSETKPAGTEWQQATNGEYVQDSNGEYQYD